MPLDVGRVTHLLEQMHRSEDDSGDPIAVDKVLVTDGARGFTWEDYGGGTNIGECVNVMDYGATGDGVTDDTAAIQDAIDGVTAAGTQSGCVYFPPGVYIIGGALQDTGAYNGQILFPTVATTDPQVQIRLVGAAQGPFMFAGPRPDPNGYSVLKSTLTGATGTAAVFSGGNDDYTNKNNVAVGLENLLCLVPDDPTMTFWNLSNTQASGNLISGVFILPDASPWGASDEPTHTNAYAIKLPQQGQSNYGNVNGLGIGGFYTGILMGELSIIRGANIGLCKVAVEIPEMFHPFLIVDLVNAGCEIGISVTGEVYGDILQWDTEHLVSPSPAWQETVWDLSDPNDFLHGHIRWYSFEGNTLTRDHSFLVDGAANVTYEEIGEGPIIVEDEGTPLATGAWRLNFTGAGVTVTGTGLEKTITISGAAAETGHWEVVVSGTAPPVAVTNEAEDDWVYGFVPD